MNEANKEIIEYIKKDVGFITDDENNCMTQFSGFCIRTSVDGKQEVVSSFHIIENDEDDSVLVTVVDVKFDADGDLVMTSPKGLRADLFKIEEGETVESTIAAFNKKYKKFVVSDYFAI